MVKKLQINEVNPDGCLKKQWHGRTMDIKYIYKNEIDSEGTPGYYTKMNKKAHIVSHLIFIICV